MLVVGREGSDLTYVHTYCAHKLSSCYNVHTQCCCFSGLNIFRERHRADAAVWEAENSNIE